MTQELKLVTCPDCNVMFNALTGYNCEKGKNCSFQGPLDASKAEAVRTLVKTVSDEPRVTYLSPSMPR